MPTGIEVSYNEKDDSINNDNFFNLLMRGANKRSYILKLTCS